MASPRRGPLSDVTDSNLSSLPPGEIDPKNTLKRKSNNKPKVDEHSHHQSKTSKTTKEPKVYEQHEQSEVVSTASAPRNDQHAVKLQDTQNGKHNDEDDYLDFHDGVIRHFHHKLRKRLRCLKGAFLDASSATKLGITIVGGLEIDTGIPVHDLAPHFSSCFSERVFEPINIAKMKEMLDEIKPDRNILSLRESCACRTNYEDSEMVFHYIAYLLELPKKNDIWADETIIADRTHWRTHLIQPELLQRHSHKGEERWIALMVRRYCIQNNGKLPRDINWQGPADPGMPHIVASVADIQTFKNGIVSNSEATTILFLAAQYGFTAEHWQHRKIPVSIVSCSRLKVRIVNALVDLRSWKVEVRLSPIIDVEETFQRGEDEFLKLLGWMIPRPCPMTC